MILLSLAFLLSANVGFATSSGYYYPNVVNGPYYGEVTGSILDPAPGSKWAFGLFTNCCTPFLGVGSFYGSAQYGYSPRTYSGGAQYLVNPPAPYRQYQIDSQFFSAWTPNKPGQTMSQYQPQDGQNCDGYGTGPGTPYYTTSYPGWSSASDYVWMSDNTQTQYNWSVSPYVTFECCQNGTGCS